ncbi:MAG: acyl-CoA dehydrogenase family protein [Acidimicrobiia bacterium]
MDLFELSAQSRQLLEEAQAIGTELAPLAEKDPSSINRPLLAALAERGLLGRLFPNDGNVSALDLCLIRQGLARSSTHAETAFAMQGLGANPIFQSGSKEMIARFIPAVARGESVPAFALTEPGAGSDAAHIELRAETDGEGFRLSGEKTYISNAPEADVYTVFARTSEGRGGISAFAVAGSVPGVSGQKIAMMSPHPIGRVAFDGVRVERADMIGGEGDGFAVAMKTLDLFRPSVGAFAVGMAEAARDLALNHASTRQAFGRPIVRFQAVSHLLANMAIEIEAARMLVYRAAAAHDRASHDLLTGLAAAAKVFATETAQRAVDGALQILGARGLEEDHPLARLYQEVRAPRIYEGTSEIQRNVIAREVAAGRWPR